MQCLIIGGTGNLSYACAQAALAAGLTVFTLNRGLKPAESAPGAVTLKADIRDGASVRAAVGDRRFGAVVDFISYNPEQLAGSLDLLGGRTDQYVFVSTASAYRKPPVHQVVTEGTPLANPFWAYSRDKIACERLLVAVGRERSLPYTIVRPSHTYGRGWLPLAFGSSDFTIAARMLAGQELIVHGDGQALWTLTHARDFAAGLVGLLGHPGALGEAVQIMGEEALTWDAIHRTVAAALGVEPRIVHIPSDFIAAVDPGMGERLLGDKTYSALFDCSKLKRLVPGFRTTTPLHVGVRESVDWLLADPTRQTINAGVDATIERLLAAWRRAMAAALG
ncbi:NAD-dependent epimerase/dehydratase family protein [uncultured Thiodictyon sp.]|uniref:NAD-dependent epimerase/dehydratase family protein n=1 Tax=uncultured Thiodictyon sp. TaxID=1846217 RepID=UPI0025FFDFF6|nr:NAD-dependent epimerase/dehydratase family protein [uncultured Thiodictyon sp.]